MPLHITRRALTTSLATLLMPPPIALGAEQAGIAEQLGLPLGNPTFTPSGRLIVSHHPMFETDVQVSEVVGPGQLRPFPDAAWNGRDRPDDQRLDAVLGIRSDGVGRVWMLDMGSRSGIAPKFVIWDTKAGSLYRVLPITPSALTRHSEPNDFVLDARRGAAYIADEGVGRGGDGSGAAIIVVDLATGKARRVLEGTRSTRAEDVPVLVDGQPMIKTTAAGAQSPMRVGCDGIALDGRGEWLYYGPLSGTSIYRVPAASLLDAALSPQALESRVERYASRPVGGGIAIDSADNLYLTEVGGRAVGVIPAADRTYRRLASHPEMLWPDGLTFGPDGMMYVTVAQLPLSKPLHGGVAAHRAPYLLMRFRPLAPGVVGS